MSADADGWSNFRASIWRQRAARLPLPPSGTLADEDSVLRGLRTLARMRDSGEFPGTLRLFRNGRLCESEETPLPTADDPTLAAYAQRLSRLFRGDRFGIQVSGFQICDDEIWRRCTGLLRTLYDEVGIPASGAELDLFVGDYEQSPLGLHKDDQDVFTVAVVGTKRLVTFPFEVFRDLDDTTATAQYRVHKLGAMDYSAYLSAASVLEATGDEMLYHPGEHWHTTETDGGLVVSLGLGVSPVADVRDIARTALAGLQERGESVPEVFPPQPTGDVRALASELGDRVARLLAGPAAVDVIDTVVINHLSSFGFYLSPPLLERPVLTCANRVVGAKNRTLVWIDRGTGRITFGAAGKSFVCSAADSVFELFAWVRRCEPASVGSLLDRIVGDGHSDADQDERASLRELLELLVSCRAVRLA